MVVQKYGEDPDKVFIECGVVVEGRVRDGSAGCRCTGDVGRLLPVLVKRNYAKKLTIFTGVFFCL